MTYANARRQVIIEIENADDGLQEGVNRLFFYDTFNNCATCGIRYATSNHTKLVEPSDLILLSLNRDGEDTQDRGDVDIDVELTLPLVTGGLQRYAVICGIEHFGSIHTGITIRYP